MDRHENHGFGFDAEHYAPYEVGVVISRVNPIGDYSLYDYNVLAHMQKPKEGFWANFGAPEYDRWLEWFDGMSKMILF